MSTETPEQLDVEIRRLERDRRAEEIRQLRDNGRRQWITPAALAALLPLLAGLGLWVVGELKQLNKGYAALQEIEAVRAEKDALQRQKDSLNIEVSTLLDLRRHYADQAKEYRDRFAERQAQLDASYLRARFASAEASYALGHLAGMGAEPDPASLERLAAEVAALPAPLADDLGEILQRYGLAAEMIEITQATLGAFAETLGLLPVSDWAAQLMPMPSGAVVPGRDIMVSQGNAADTHDGRYYDVGLGRMLTEAEIGQMP